ncbi:ATP phosphoribosyltransferase regulatory subunit [Sinimarinibacterium sp. CAU 1509]|uniref:ATP phosphoribosyltransferase regulatory subunit n=1 Tax=Sinimarinibacterium sp. CAU 1509 TaxID=2562283 RepID=UPI0010AD56AE|nr:ATP phosphoribosyltransferase regulatory subunit [Sinimarinibacterium sp. CAU 1509]TJY60921.1 ATP phosphoribosyltransferase regulatory subunit [Sinimarinibacterium sp. CAU 1509]
MSIRKWMLPEGVEEALPPLSWQMEDLRRKLLDCYRKQKYELIVPPLIEHLDALLTGTAQGLEQQTFKLTDPASGRLLGLRADMTPQAARIAARHYADQPVVRLCYLGTVLRTAADALGGARAPRQVGCEIFGMPGLDGDLEVLQLMLKTLKLAGVRKPHLDLGHVGIYRALVGRLRLGADDEAALFDILQRKSHPDLDEFASQRGLKPKTVAAVAELMDLNGDPSVLARARSALAQGGTAVEAALADLERVVVELQKVSPRLPIHIDLAELRGYRYHTGMVYAVFVPGYGREIARGGRYDGVGAEFGAARPATGFSADLNDLLRLGEEART